MITVIGLGFVGLTTALGFAEKGFKVYGYEINNQRFKQISKGNVPFHEPSLKEMLLKHKNKNFELSRDLKKIINESTVIFICVGTPSKESGEVDLIFINSAIKDIIKNLDSSSNNHKVICIKSTVPPSTTKTISEKYSKLKNNIGFTSNPEFLREGFAWEDFLYPDRIIIGYENIDSFEAMKKIYCTFDSKIYGVNFNTAEFIKYSSNALLSNLISFANELSIIGHSMKEIDIKKTFEILHKDKRWNGNPAGMSSYFYPGCGFGGYCLPKDLEGLIDISNKHGYVPNLLKNISKVNNEIASFLLNKVLKDLDSNTSILILGLSFKPNSDDVRNTPAAKIINELIKRGFSNINAFDPIAIDSYKSIYNQKVNYFHDLNLAIEQSDVSIITTKWDFFKQSLDIISKKVYFDLRYYL